MELGPAGKVRFPSGPLRILRIDYVVNGCYVDPMAELKRFEMLAPPEWLEMVDDWRRRQKDLPSRAEAIRRLVDLALDYESFREKKR